ncbi:MAG TPA: hypothetical protein VMS71_02380, partial [Candidatus Acidoferrum sp.]|nr:hypothetical protein [Candidatus Acidoferrum sp.]
MLGLKHLSLDFLTHVPVLVWLALIGLLALAILLYYRTNPPLPKYLRILMGVLRVVAVLALAAALLEPVLSYNREFERPRRISILLDQSASMEKVESEKSRTARLDSLLSSDAYARLKGTTEIQIYYFGDNLAESSDKVREDRTALGDVIDALKTKEMTQPADLWMLMTDGRSNAGRAPLEAARG